MGVYIRALSRFYWVRLERPGLPAHRVSTKIPIGSTSGERKQNRALAEAVYSTMMGDVARERFELPSQTRPRTFDAHAAWYEEHHTARHRGARQERPIVARLRRMFGALPLSEIRPSRWQEYATTRANAGVSENTVGRELAVMKAILMTAVGDYLEVSPLVTVKRRSAKVKAKRTITKGEEPAFMRALKAADAEVHDMYVVGVGTLLRQENILHLRRGAHRGDRLVVETKTGPLQVPLTGPTPLQRRAAAVLKRRMPKAADGFFFPRWHARFTAYKDPSHPRVQLLRIVEQAAAAAGIPWGLKQDGIVWHTATRASGATRLLREYHLDVRSVQLMGGWTSLDQMAAYLGHEAAVLFGRAK